MMDKYVRVARVYPAVLGLLPTCILLAMCMEEWFPHYQEMAGNVKWVLCLVGGTALVCMAVGYFVRELFKETSKLLFQKNETEMPTTQMLLWRNEKISPEYHKELADKVKETFGKKLPTRKEEEADLDMAKKRIAETVRQIRQNCRGDEILRQYNIEFGFCRNYLGASVWSVILIIGMGVVNAFCCWLPWWTVVIALILQILLMAGCYMMLKKRGWTYAEYLFATFTGKSNS